VEPDSGDGKYQIEFKGREVAEDRVLRVKYGKVERLFRIADVSNGDFEDVRHPAL
jgi:RNA polymerase-associated protein RTF1